MVFRRLTIQGGQIGLNLLGPGGGFFLAGFDKGDDTDQVFYGLGIFFNQHFSGHDIAGQDFFLHHHAGSHGVHFLLYIFGIKVKLLEIVAGLLEEFL